jgi:hypothetical protein
LDYRGFKEESVKKERASMVDLNEIIPPEASAPASASTQPPAVVQPAQATTRKPVRRTTKKNGSAAMRAIVWMVVIIAVIALALIIAAYVADFAPGSSDPLVKVSAMFDYIRSQLNQ